jgi:uncharacterized membrane protein
MKTLQNVTRIMIALIFIGASSLHFFSDAELHIIPPFLPWRHAALYLTGVAELLGGIGLLIPRFKRPASWGLAILLVAIFPANIYHAVANVQLGGFFNSRLYQWGRLPLQPLFIWLVLWSTRSSKG